MLSSVTQMMKLAGQLSSGRKKFRVFEGERKGEGAEGKGGSSYTW